MQKVILKNTQMTSFRPFCRPRSTTSAFVVVVFCLLLGTLPAALAAKQIETVSSAVTLTTEFCFDQTHLSTEAASEGIWLAGITGTGRNSSDVSLVWGKNSKAWVPIWRLYLKVPEASVSADLRPRQESGFLKGGWHIPLSRLEPVPGHRYRSVISYDPASETLGLALTDLTAEKTLLAECLRLGVENDTPGRESEGPLRFSAEYRAPDLPPWVETCTLVPGFVPFGIEWTIVGCGQQDSGNEGPEGIGVGEPHFAQGNVPAVRFAWPVRNTLSGAETGPSPPRYRIPCTLRVILHDDGKRFTAAEAQTPLTDVDYPLTLPELSPGRYPLTLEGVIGRESWVLARGCLSLGSVMLRVKEVIYQAVDPLTVSIEGRLELQSDVPISDPRIRLQASLQNVSSPRPAEPRSGLELSWQEGPVFSPELEEISEEAQDLRFRALLNLPAPDPGPHTNQQILIRVRLEPEIPVQGESTLYLPLAGPPRQIILTWEDSPETSITVSWRTDGPARESFISYAPVISGTDIPQDKQRVAATQTHLAGSTAWIHKATITGLRPGQEYAATVTADCYTSEPFRFKTLPGPGEELLFLAGGDSRSDREVRRAINKLACTHEPAFVLFNGDLIENAQDEAEWDAWFDDWTELMRTPAGRLIPVIPAVGNHEVEISAPPAGNSDARERAPVYYHRFPLPGEECYYALYLGKDLLLVTLDSGHTSGVTDPQLAWLEKTLQSAAGCRWIIVQYHVPAFPSVREFHAEIPALIRKHWVPLFERYGVDLVIEAHDHAYKRTEPIRAGRVDVENGIVYIGDGGWGAPLRIPRVATQHWWLAEARKTYHYWVLTLSPDRSTLTVRPVFCSRSGEAEEGHAFTVNNR